MSMGHGDAGISFDVEATPLDFDTDKVKLAGYVGGIVILSNALQVEVWRCRPHQTLASGP